MEGADRPVDDRLAPTGTEWRTNMCITEDKLVESYGKATPRERFRLIYKNYSIFPQLVDCYEIGLFNRILFEVEYNRRKKNDDDLGVRIQTSHRSDPTAAKAIEHIMIRDAIEECNFSGNILKETDDPEKHKRDILTIHMMRREYEVFDTSLKALPLAEFKITYSHLHDGRKLVEIAEEEDKAYQTILNIVSKTRKKLEGKTIAFFRETIQEG